MITHEEAKNLARMFGRAVATKDAWAQTQTNILLNKYLEQPDALPVGLLVRYAVTEAEKQYIISQFKIK